jgi:hypothetical protein
LCGTNLPKEGGRASLEYPRSRSIRSGALCRVTSIKSQATLPLPRKQVVYKYCNISRIATSLILGSNVIDSLLPVRQHRDPLPNHSLPNPDNAHGRTFKVWPVSGTESWWGLAWPIRSRLTDPYLLCALGVLSRTYKAPGRKREVSVKSRSALSDVRPGHEVDNMEWGQI